MIISFFLLIITFLVVIILIAIDKFDRTILAIIGGIITYLILILLENAESDVIIRFIVGTKEENFVNLRSLVLIFGMMIIIQICMESGLFEFLAFRVIQMTKGNPRYLIISFSSIGFLFSAIINDITAFIVLIPLTITVCKTLKIDAVPYIIMQIIVIKLGSTIFLISSVPSILIAAYAHFSFIEFFMNIGVFTLIVYGITLILFYRIFRNKLKPPQNRQQIKMLLEFNIMTFIPDKSSMYRAFVVLIFVICGFILIPQEILSVDIIAIIGASILMLINRVDAKEFFKKINFKLIIYLIGMFILMGGLQYIGVITVLGNNLANIIPNDSFIAFLTILWLSALLSAFVDNVPVTQIMLPTADILIGRTSNQERNYMYSGVSYGVNWGDSLFPIGDIIFPLNIAEENGVVIKPFHYYKYGGPIAVFQLIIISIIFLFLFNPLIGLIIFTIIFGSAAIIYLFLRFYKNKSGIFREYK